MMKNRPDTFPVMEQIYCPELRYEPKVIFLGPPGSGKTTAIVCASDASAVTTDRLFYDEDLGCVTTTVALDYGELCLADEMRIRLYGCPGRPHFEFMIPVLSVGAMGIIVLFDRRDDSATLTSCRSYLLRHRDLLNQKAWVIGIQGVDIFDLSATDAYDNVLNELGLTAPILYVDVRQRRDIVSLLNSLCVCFENQESV